MNRTEKQFYTYLLSTTLILISGHVFLYFFYKNYISLINNLPTDWIQMSKLIMLAGFFITYLATFIGYIISYRLYKDSKKLQYLLNNIDHYTGVKIKLTIKNHKGEVFLKKNQTYINNQEENSPYDNSEKYVYPTIILLEDGRFFGLSKDVIQKSDDVVYLIKESKSEHFFMQDLYLSLCSFDELFLKKHI